MVTLAEAGHRPTALRFAHGLGHAATPATADDTVLLSIAQGATLPVDYLTALAAAGIGVCDVRVDAPSLDDAVIALTA